MEAMPGPGVRRAGAVAIAAFSLQFLLGASPLPCTSMDHAGGGDGALPQVAMAGMPMSDTGASDHTSDDCSTEQSAPACQSGSACLVVAIPAATSALTNPQQAAVAPAAAPAVLRSALTAPDRPPPRA